MPSDGSVPLSTLLLTNADFPIGLLIAIIALIIMSGFFSSTETAYSCVNRIKLRSLAANGDKKAKKVGFCKSIFTKGVIVMNENEKKELIKIILKKI